MSSINMKLPLHKNFVSPHLCEKLLEAGLSVSTPFYWKRVGNIFDLDTDEFDPDRYYEGSRAHVDYVLKINNIHPKVFPAFTLMDMEQLIPDYYIDRSTCGLRFSLMCDSMYGMDAVQGNHLPDVFAEMVLQGFHKRTINAELAVKQLSTL